MQGAQEFEPQSASLDQRQQDPFGTFLVVGGEVATVGAATGCRVLKSPGHHAAFLHTLSQLYFDLAQYESLGAISSQGAQESEPQSASFDQRQHDPFGAFPVVGERVRSIFGVGEAVGFAAGFAAGEAVGEAVGFTVGSLVSNSPPGHQIAFTQTFSQLYLFLPQ